MHERLFGPVMGVRHGGFFFFFNRIRIGIRIKGVVKRIIWFDGFHDFAAVVTFFAYGSLIPTMFTFTSSILAL